MKLCSALPMMDMMEGERSVDGGRCYLAVREDAATSTKQGMLDNDR
ncbi:hypothetical protein ACVW0A_004894 [Pseudomonas sp. TE3610]